MSSPAVQPLLCLLAYPVGGNPTQYLVERVFAQNDLDWRYLTFEVRPEDLGDAVRGLRALGFRGGHCATPHKQTILPFLDRITDKAALIGGVNLFFRDGEALVGENTEGRGLVEAIRAVRGAPAEARDEKATWATGKQAVLLGAGQLARAVAVELAAAGATGLTIVNRTEAKAAELAALLADKFGLSVSTPAWSDDYAVPPEADLLIHATSLEQDAAEVPLHLSVESLRPELIVADATAGVRQTWLLDQAAARGCRTVDGLAIFLEQVAAGLRLWTGVDPKRQLLSEAAEEFLGL
ncbi:MAG: shikimate dehydrogenase [Thermoguttaceae bacterium]